MLLAGQSLRARSCDSGRVDHSELWVETFGLSMTTEDRRIVHLLHTRIRFDDTMRSIERATRIHMQFEVKTWNTFVRVQRWIFPFLSHTF